MNWSQVETVGNWNFLIGLHTALDEVHDVEAIINKDADRYNP